MSLSLDLQISPSFRLVIILLLLVLLGTAVCLPLTREQNELGKAIHNARLGYVEAQRLARQYGALKQSQGGKKSVILQEPLFSYVEKVTRNLALNKNIDYVRPENRVRDDGSTAEVVHVSFKGLTLEEFIRFLYYIEVEKREIFIKSISIKKDGQKNLNTQMTLQKFG